MAKHRAAHAGAATQSETTAAARKDPIETRVCLPAQVDSDSWPRLFVLQYSFQAHRTMIPKAGMFQSAKCLAVVLERQMWHRQFHQERYLLGRRHRRVLCDL